jgi:hypothetical protein
VESRERFLAGRRAEKLYARQLRQVARHIGELVRSMAPDGLITVEVAEQLNSVLHRYGEVLKPWAEKVAGNMIEDVSRRDAAGLGATCQGHRAEPPKRIDLCSDRRRDAPIACGAGAPYNQPAA